MLLVNGTTYSVFQLFCHSQKHYAFYFNLSSQLQKLKVEPVLLHYLSHMRALQGNDSWFIYHSRQVKQILSGYENNLSYFLRLRTMPTLLCRVGVEDDYKYKTEGMPLQLHVSWWSHVSDKSCSSCGLGCIRFTFPSEWLSSPAFSEACQVFYCLVKCFLYTMASMH